MRRYIISIILLIVAVQSICAQTDRDLIRQGNHLYSTHKYAEAEVAYRKAIAQSPDNSRALYDLGCALQKQNRDSDAIKQYEQAVKNEPNKTVRSQGYYNMGVAYQTMKDYGKAMEAYKDCLRLNPSDNKARYNYVLCKRMQQQQQQNKNNGQNNKNNNDKNKNKDQKNQNKNQQDKKKNQDQDKNKQQQNQSQPQNGEMSKDNAEQLLQAAMNEESQTEAKLKKAMQQPSRRQLDKNW